MKQQQQQQQQQRSAAVQPKPRRALHRWGVCFVLIVIGGIAIFNISRSTSVFSSSDKYYYGRRVDRAGEEVDLSYPTTATMSGANIIPSDGGGEDDHHQQDQEYYDEIFTWHVSPNFTDFSRNPYGQFCRWRNAGNNAKERQVIAAEERWTTTTRRTATTATKTTKNNNKSLLHIQLDCYQIMKQSPFGNGNWVQMIYLLRLAVATAPMVENKEHSLSSHLDLQLSCLDDQQHDEHNIYRGLVLPWLMGHFSSAETLRVISESFGSDNNNKKAPRLETRCFEAAWASTPVGWMTPFFRQELRRMAIALVGIPSNDPTHPVHDWLREHEQQQQQHPQHERNARNGTSSTHLPFHHGRNHGDDDDDQQQQEQPLIPGIVLDDVVIHFRCGDIMASSQKYFRFLKFHEFASRIDPNAVDSIGIVTQPFGGSSSSSSSTKRSPATNTRVHDQARSRDQDDPFKVVACRKVILGFVDYLQSRFPQARISVHNGPNETVALAYARLVMAKRQAFAYPDSSFSVFPVLATFGTGLHMYPFKSPYYKYSAKNQWLRTMAGRKNQNTTVFHTGPGRVEWMRIRPNNTLFGIETLQMKNAHPQDPSRAIRDILEWFQNDTAIKPHFSTIERFNHSRD